MNDLSKALAGLEALKVPQERPALPLRSPPPATEKAWRWTEEQERVLDFQGSRLDVVALAGTGKTKVLQAYAQRRGRAKWRYLTFNRSLADEARAFFPSRVAVSTFHALAFPKYGAPLGQKLGQRFDADAVRRAVGWERFPAWETAVEALREWRAGFMVSADPLPALGQLPPPAWLRLMARPQVFSAMGGREGFLVAMEKLWAATVDPRQVAVDAPLEVTVKRMALAGMDWGSHGLLVDEAQDLTPCLWSALERQSAMALAVGDPSQNLYAWRQERSAWPAGEAPRLALSHSFRFGPQVARLANRVLSRLPGLERLEGRGPPSEVQVGGDLLGEGTTWLARTQAGALEGALAAMEKGLTAAWVGRGSLGRLAGVLDIAQGRPSRDPWLAGLSTLDEVAQTAKESAAQDWSSAVRLIRKGGLPKIQAALGALVNPASAQVKVSTVHQAKGKTFDRVALAPDFRWMAEDQEERRVGYVALTRSPVLAFSEEGFALFEHAPTPKDTGHPPASDLLDSGF